MRLRTSKGKKVTHSLICIFVLVKKKKQSLYNRNVGPTKLVKAFSALYKQKLVYQNPVKKQNYLNDSGATKLVQVCTPIQAYASLVAPVKKLNCLYELINCLNEIG